jgi:hypothetical protein
MYLAKLLWVSLGGGHIGYYPLPRIKKIAERKEIYQILIIKMESIF